MFGQRYWRLCCDSFGSCTMQWLCLNLLHETTVKNGRYTHTHTLYTCKHPCTQAWPVTHLSVIAASHRCSCWLWRSLCCSWETFSPHWRWFIRRYRRTTRTRKSKRKTETKLTEGHLRVGCHGNILFYRDCVLKENEQRCLSPPRTVRRFSATDISAILRTGQTFLLRSVWMFTRELAAGDAHVISNSQRNGKEKRISDVLLIKQCSKKRYSLCICLHVTVYFSPVKFYYSCIMWCISIYKWQTSLG